MDYNWFLHGSIPSNAIVGSYDSSLVVVSYVAAVFASYIALDLVSQIRLEQSKWAKHVWIAGGAFVLGADIWAMHFIGMLAYKMPIPMSYDPLWTGLSFLAAVFSSWIALFILSREKRFAISLFFGGVFIGVGIASMHYIGMEAMETMRMPTILYLPGYFFLSVFIAIGASEAALWLIVKSSQVSIRWQHLFKIMSAVVMGSAICGMHYCGIAAAVFIPQEKQVDIGSAIIPEKMAIDILIIIGLITSIALLLSSRRQTIMNSYIHEKESQHVHDLEAIQIRLEEREEKRITELEEKNVQLTNALDQLKLMQSNLMHTEKMATIGQLAAGIAHEINNPLSYSLSNISILQKHIRIIQEAIALYNHLMDEVMDSSSKNLQTTRREILAFFADKNLSFILSDLDGLIFESKDGLLRIKRIVSNLSNFSSPAQSDLVKFDINQSIEAAIEVVWNELKYKCSVIKRLSELPLFTGSSKQFQLIFVNLLLNSAQAISSKGEIVISSWADNADILVSITDNGCGIAPENINKLFTPFFTTKSIGSGTGLGLATIYGIITAYNGTITVKSELAHGTTFTLRLPIQNNRTIG